MHIIQEVEKDNFFSLSITPNLEATQWNSSAVNSEQTGGGSLLHLWSLHVMKEPELDGPIPKDTSYILILLLTDASQLKKKNLTICSTLGLTSVCVSEV